MIHPFDPAGGLWQARQLHDDLVAGYRGRRIEDVFCGREVDTSSGTCYVLESRSAADLDGRDPDRAASAVLADLTLVRGIGEATGRRLNREGYRTVEDLVGHPRYGREAARLLFAVGRGDTRGLADWIGRRHRCSDPLVLEVSRFHDAGDLLFFDIETLGLSGRPIILIGLARIEGGSIVVRQYLLRSVAEEKAALAAVLPDLEADDAALVTFNGRAFDLPYVRDRLARHGIPADLTLPHFDILPPARRRWKDSLGTCRLGALEAGVLGIGRENDIPSGMVPAFYETYRRTGNPGPLVPVVEHNRQDLVSLVRLFGILRGDGDCGA
ncbi:exonuclease [Methanoculleus sp. Wushi-C6]|uniref:Exonuclease n=1 Tax=Methanoculleus caldifontis TaxID=2651577 RepID=A0ABU3WYB7_9EURY|nr:ribonuclease H-like domain-containing protein [Methanoculleus sp. Wushi-C6]MDV2480790.1 exonuclease [Methanoculleus sp. Wushi-C6]